MLFYVYDENTSSTAPIEVSDIPELSEQELEFIYDDKIRKVWHSQEEEWYFSIIDVIDVLTDSSDPKQYVKKLRSRDPELSANWGTICTPIQMIAADGKMRKIQATNTHGLLRIIQSIPSKKAEPFKQWLAMVGKQRLDEEVDPQIAIDRAIESYRNKGYSEDWIAQRMRGIEIRKDMTNEWRRAGITDSRQYASLTNILTAAWSGKTVKEYKKFKGLKKENLRDNMTNTELVLNALAEISTTEISKATNPQGITEATDATIQGGNIARNARESLEKQIGKTNSIRNARCHRKPQCGIQTAVWNTDHNICFHRMLLPKNPTSVQPCGVHTSAFNHRVRTCKIHIFKHTHRPLLSAVCPNGMYVAIFDHDNFSGFNISLKFRIDTIQCTGFRCEYNAAIFTATHTKRTESVWISRCNQLVRRHHDQ